MNLLGFIIVALAAYRVTRLVVTDTLLNRPRDWVFTHAPLKVAELIDCPHCVGVWAAGATTAIYLLAPDIGLKCLLPFAAAGVVSIIATFDRR